MRFGYMLVSVLLILAAAPGCTTYEGIGGEGTQWPSGIIRFGGVDIAFPFVPETIPLDATIAITNRNDESVYVEVRDLTRSSVLVSKLVFGNSGSVINNVEYVKGPRYAEGDEIEIRIWRGLKNSLLQAWKFSSAPPDIKGTAVLAIGILDLSVSSFITPYEIALPTIKGVSFRLAGAHAVNSPTIQEYNVLYGHNQSSDSVTSRMYKLNHVSGSTYAVNFEVAQATLLIGNYFTRQIGISIFPYEVYALRVNVSFTSKADYTCFTMNVADQVYSPVTCNVTFP